MIILDYFYWHYLTAPKKILQIWSNFLQFFVLYFIPIPHILKSLLSPWKKDISSYGRGFELKRFIQTLLFNIISRVLGAVVRTITICLALALELLTFFIGLAFLIFWVFWPFFLASSLVSGGYLLFQPGLVKLGTLGILIVDLASIFTFWIFYQKSKQKPPEQLSLQEVFEQEWAPIIWERLGLKQEQVPENVLAEPEKFLDDFLKENSLEKEDFSAVIEWQILNQSQKQRKKKFWEKENLFGKGGIGRTWLYGWTVNLDKYSHEMKGLPESAPLVGRQQGIQAMETILCKSTQGNVLLVGEPGVGKKTIVRHFAKLVQEGKVASPIAYRRVLDLDLNAALAGLKNPGEANERLLRIFSEAMRAGNIILAIDDFHNFISPPNPDQKDISPILLPFLEGSHFQLIAVTTYQGLHGQIEKNPSLLKFFEKVEIKEPDLAQSLVILQDAVPELEKRTQKRITYLALKEVVKTSNQYIADTPMPEKALDLLEEATIFVTTNTADYFVLPKHVDTVVSQKTEVPVGELQTTEKERLLNLEDFLHQRVIDQELAVKEVASAMRRARLGVAATNRPMGSFLFLGPTGVGKTETAKALAEAYFGSEQRMLRFDMSEYQGATAVERMIGSALTQQSGTITTAVRENPFSLLLLDEIEKADPNVLNLFLQVLDEGWLTDALGRKVNFRNLIIIATSNASAELIRQMVQQGADPNLFKQKILDFIQQNAIFKPEFLNRFDGIIIFKPLSQDNILQIAKLILNSLAKRLEEQELFFQLNEQLLEKVAQIGYDPVYGARSMRRVIQDKVEDLIAKKLLRGEIEKHKPFEIKAEEIQ